MAERTPAGYLAELDEIGQKLSDFIELVNAGKLHYYKDIALKLRVLYCRKSGTPALFKKICDLHAIDIYVMVLFSFTDRMEKGELPESIARAFMDAQVFEQTNSVVSWLGKGHEKRLLLDAIEKPEITIGDKRLSYKELIEVVADKMAAHIDHQIDDLYLEMHSDLILIGGLPIAQRALFDTARTTIEIIHAVLGHIREQQEFRFVKPREDSA